MSTIGSRAAVDTIYNPLSKRLIDFGNDAYEHQDNNNIHTTLWLFTFYSEENLCEPSQPRFTEMHTWFDNYGLFNDPISNVKWVVEDEPSKNLIYTEMGFTKNPMHIFTDSDGNIFDIFIGFPNSTWLEKHILPLIRKGS